MLAETSLEKDPYGISHLESLGYHLQESRPARRSVHAKVRDVVEHRLGYPVDQSFRGFLKATQVDVVFAVLERYAIAPAAWKRRGVPGLRRRPLSMLSCWLSDDLKRLPRNDRKELAARFRGVDLTVVLSENQIDVLVDSGFHPSTVRHAPFGIDTSEYPHVGLTGRDIEVLAVGFDRGRDYATLVEAVRGTDIAVELYCKERNIAHIDLPPNVHYRGLASAPEYRSLLKRAQVVAIPTEAMEYPSGQTVALQAGASGACLVMTTTPALREYFTEDTAVLVSPGDVQGWRNSLRRALHDEELRRRLGTKASAMFHRMFEERGWASIGSPGTQS